MTTTKETPEQILRRLSRLRSEIEDAKEEKNRLLGKREGLIQRLNREFWLKDKDEAQKKIAALEQVLIRRNRMIDKLYKELKDKYEL